MRPRFDKCNSGASPGRGRTDMAPQATRCHSRHLRAAYAKPLGQGEDPGASRPGDSRRSNVGVGELCSRVAHTRGGAPLPVAVGRVVRFGSLKNMIRSHAKRIVAAVKPVGLRPSAFRQEERHAVRAAHLPLKANQPVAVPVFAREPSPAASTALDLGPKAGPVIAGHLEKY